MLNNLQPWQILLTALAGWINRHQLSIIHYLQEENCVLREQVGRKRLRLTDEQRRRLAAKGKALGHKALCEITTIVTPDTLMAWHRRLIAMKWNFSARRKGPGRPRVMREIVDLVVRMAQENTTWGYTKIQGALANLGYEVARGTIANIFAERGIDPAPRRRRGISWKTFLNAHWESLAAADFFTVEVWVPRGLVTFYVLIVMELSTRRIHFAGSTPNPNETWMRQIARNLTDPWDGFVQRKRFILMDRDQKYCDGFRSMLNNAGVEPVRLPPRSLNLNGYAERFIRSIKDECFERMIFFGEKSLRERSSSTSPITTASAIIRDWTTV